MKINKKIYNRIYKKYDWLSKWISKVKLKYKIELLLRDHFLENDYELWSIQNCVKNNIILDYLYYYNKEYNNKICYWSNWNDDFYIHWINKYRIKNKDVELLNNHFWL